ncbi:MAG: hypothetical protein ACOYKN_13985 [Pirellula sp.]
MNNTTMDSSEEAGLKQNNAIGRRILAPLFVYFAAGLQGLTAMASLLFVKELLALTAEQIASVTFWLMLPWSMKIFFGQLADQYWQRKVPLMATGIGLVAVSNILMIGLLQFPSAFGSIEVRGAWYCFVALLSPLGFVIQDVVADGMTVEIGKQEHQFGHKLGNNGQIQSLGRIAFLLGMLVTWCVNIIMFDDQESLSISDSVRLYSFMYSIGLLGPCFATLGLFLAFESDRSRTSAGKPNPFDWGLLLGCLAYVTIIAILQAMPFFASNVTALLITILATILMIRHLLKGHSMDSLSYRQFVGTAIVLWVFNATPEIGPGLHWWQIDKLGFDAKFLSVLNLLGTSLALVALFLISRSLCAEFNDAHKIIVILTILKGFLFLPDICIYYELHTQFTAITGLPLSARTIAIADTACESSLIQVASVPVLVWVAKHAPRVSMATFFAAGTSLINSSTQCKMLLTQWLNSVFVVSREVCVGDKRISSDYSALGGLLQTVFFCNLLLPLAAAFVVSAFLRSEKSRLRCPRNCSKSLKG